MLHAAPLRLGTREEYARVDALFEDAGGLALSGRGCADFRAVVNFRFTEFSETRGGSLIRSTRTVRLAPCCAN
jgi:hypothetical protein